MIARHTGESTLLAIYGLHLSSLRWTDPEAEQPTTPRKYGGQFMEGGAVSTEKEKEKEKEEQEKERNKKPSKSQRSMNYLKATLTLEWRKGRKWKTASLRFADEVECKLWLQALNQQRVNNPLESPAALPIPGKSRLSFSVRF